MTSKCNISEWDWRVVCHYVRYWLPLDDAKNALIGSASTDKAGSLVRDKIERALAGSSEGEIKDALIDQAMTLDLCSANQDEIYLASPPAEKVSLKDAWLSYLDDLLKEADMAISNASSYEAEAAARLSGRPSLQILAGSYAGTLPAGTVFRAARAEGGIVLALDNGAEVTQVSLSGRGSLSHVFDRLQSLGVSVAVERALTPQRLPKEGPLLSAPQMRDEGGFNR